MESSVTDVDAVVTGCPHKCPPGRYGSNTPPTVVNQTTGAKQFDFRYSPESCTECPAGAFCEEAAGYPMNCSSGFYCPGNSSFERPCPIGTYSPNGSSFCSACMAGFYSQGVQSKCKACAPGLFLNESGKSQCIKCPPGTWGNETGVNSSHKCHRCPAGRYSRAEGADRISACVSCPPGKAGQNPGASTADSCDDCPRGFLQSEPGKTSCEPLKQGAVVLGGGATSVVVPDGSFIVATSCAGNDGNLGKGAQDSCRDAKPFLACPAGWIGHKPPNQTCTACAPGQSSVDGSTHCSKCS